MTEWEFESEPSTATILGQEILMYLTPMGADRPIDPTDRVASLLEGLDQGRVFKTTVGGVRISLARLNPDPMSEEIPRSTQHITPDSFSATPYKIGHDILSSLHVKETDLLIEVCLDLTKQAAGPDSTDQTTDDWASQLKHWQDLLVASNHDDRYVVFPSLLYNDIPVQASINGMLVEMRLLDDNDEGAHGA